MYFSPLAMRELVAGLGPRTAAAVSALLPGPVTLVVANPEHRYPLACREDVERLGIRLIAGPLAGVMCPVFQTSANLSGEPAPARFEDVPAAIVAGADLAIDGGELTGLPSTVVDIAAIEDDGSWKILRAGRALAGRPGERPRLGRPRLQAELEARGVAAGRRRVKGRRTRRREVLSLSFDSNSRCCGSTVIAKAKQPRRPPTSIHCWS